MIKEFPKSEEYKNVAVECLIQAYNNIVNVESKINGDTPREEIWDYNQIVLRTAIVLIHQGIEALLKSEICNKTPLLLIDKKRGEWKSLPQSSDESFNDMYTIGGEDLLKTFYACVGTNKVHENFFKHYEEIRIKRNKIVHGVEAETISPEYVLKLILSSFTYLLGKDSFWASVIDKFYDHPGFEHDDTDVELEETVQYERMDQLKQLIGIGELKKHFSIY